MARALPVAFPSLSNLVALPGAAAKGLGHVGTASADYVDDICAPIFFMTGATVGVAASVVQLYIVVAEEILTGGAGFTDGIDPDSVSTQHTKISDATEANLISSIGGASEPLAINTLYCFPGFSIMSVLGYRPTFWAPFVWNRQGVGNPLNSTAANFYAKHTLLT